MKHVRRLTRLWPMGVGLVLGATVASGANPPTAAELARQLNQAFIDVAEKVSPAVVVVRVAHKPEYTELNPDNNPFYDMVPELRREWEEQYKKYHRRPARREPVFDGEGSGVIIREDGYILTNSHLVEGADRIIIRLQNGKEYDKVEVKGVDSHSDIAVLKIDAKGLTAARMGDSSRTRVGEFAIAIGAPYELDYSVTVGHVSAKGRRIFSDRVMIDQDFIQTDASINPGNSGGPLVNIDGEIIGINTLIRGMNRGIGFAVPINLAKEVGEKLIDSGKFTRAWLGIGIADLSNVGENARLVSRAKEGVLVTSILPGGPSSRSELEPADVIVAVDGTPTPTSAQLKSEIRRKPVGESVTLNVLRGEKQLKLKISPGEMPNDTAEVAQVEKPEKKADVKSFGLKVQTLTRELAKQFGTDATTGVIVTEVEANSVAERHGIKPGEIITQVNRKKVTTSQQFDQALKSADLKQGVVVNLSGDTGRRFEILEDSGD
jgi:serine protease Do